jgi:hypothetical protein
MQKPGKSIHAGFRYSVVARLRSVIAWLIVLRRGLQS